MPETLPQASTSNLGADTAAFYRRVLRVLCASRVPFLIGGAYAFNCYTTIERHTRDLDLFIRRRDIEGAADALLAAGHGTELTHPHWLAKVHAGDLYIDLIYSSGNGLCEVDDDWFRHASAARVLGVDVKVAPVEEMIWSKAFVMERERYDGADVAHLLHAHGHALDWRRLLQRFGPHWRVLLSHLVLYGFIYPAARAQLPDWPMQHLLERLRDEHGAPPPRRALCAGTLLSREQYLGDVERHGYQDARQAPFGNMTRDEIAAWTARIPERDAP
jgi:hypothetical protein